MKPQAWGDAIERREHRDKARRIFQRASEARPRVATRPGAPAPARSASDGLVVAAYLSVARDARLVQVHLPGIALEAPEVRGKCDGMSEDAQRRLLTMLHTIRRDAALPVMVTLTFPSEVTVTPAEAKSCRLAWEKRMRRIYGARWCNVWRLEAHPEMSARLGRVHPHFHLLTWGAFYDFALVSKTWTEVVWKVLKVDECLECNPSESDGHGMCLTVKEKHQRAGTSCERIRQWGGVLYSAKNYIAKDEEYPLGQSGRVWGYHNRAALPLAKVERIPLTHQQAMGVRVEIEAWMKAKRIVSEHLVCTFFEDDPSMFVARLMRCQNAGEPPF